MNYTFTTQLVSITPFFGGFLVDFLPVDGRRGNSQSNLFLPSIFTPLALHLPHMHVIYVLTLILFLLSIQQTFF